MKNKNGVTGQCRYFLKHWQIEPIYAKHRSNVRKMQIKNFVVLSKVEWSLEERDPKSADSRAQGALGSEFAVTRSGTSCVCALQSRGITLK